MFKLEPTANSIHSPNVRNISCGIIYYYDTIVLHNNITRKFVINFMELEMIKDFFQLSLQK